MKAYLLGEKLGHSFSPQIHHMLGDYAYALRELAPDQLGAFLQNGDFDGLNITIPYKRAAMEYCAELTEIARGIGCVNTIVRRKDGTLLGDNTDAAGFESMLRRLNVNPEGRHALVLGSGGASKMAQYVLSRHRARVTVISRGGTDNYENIARHADAYLLVNATPVGMYPNNGECLVHLDALPKLAGVMDLIYNPARTALILRAMDRGIPAIDGLYMLVEQARCAAERFTNQTIPADRTDQIYRALRRDMQNMILIGMPGSGKTSIGRAIAKLTNRAFYDADDYLADMLHMPVPEYLKTHTEAEFRNTETCALSELGKLSGAVIATGGGCVTQRDNYDLLRQNGKIIFVQRDIALLPTDGRPLSQAGSLDAMYQKRLPMYRAFADAQIENNTTIEAAANRAVEVYNEIAGA